MPTPFFDFKQFRVYQRVAGLKVTTEACLFGAIVGRHFSPPPGVFQALDIGAGTGLLSLIMAQNFEQAEIHAVEIEPKAALQAVENIELSPWGERIKVVRGDISTLAVAHTRYSLVVSNPPFYENHLQSHHNPDRTRAMHANTLSYKQLLESVVKRLDKDGRLYLLFPPRPHQLFQELAEEAGLYVNQEWHIRQKPGSATWRVVAMYSHKKTASPAEEVIIHAQEGGYHPQYISYLKPYYVKL